MIVVLRLGHRPPRDKRTTTHLALVARAFGADKLVMPTLNEEIKRSVDEMTRRWGGSFEVEFYKDWKAYIKKWEGTTVHLTMYGEGMHRIKDIPKDNLLVIAGAEKVPLEVYKLVDYNIAVTHQPHSEIGALAVFLDRYCRAKHLRKKFMGQLRALPSKHGKRVIRIPGEKECVRMLRRVGCSKEVAQHCKAVRDLSMRIAGKISCDRRLVEAGALLHDLGRAVTHGASHGYEGGRLARKLNLPPQIIRIIERHVGAGIKAEEAQKLGMPKKDFVPYTLEEKIVCHADNLIVHCKKEALRDAVKRYIGEGREDIAEKIRELHRELSKLYGVDLNH